ncbi:MAG TPA: hypothetical protein VL946_03725, partial [Lacibacter sp.]|nr:hypothetical protein [Lacibacter sp.]
MRFSLLKYPLAVFSLFVAPMLTAQTTGKNYVLINPGDTEKQIIAKAANVTASARQLRWQKLELTAFFHFGVNTFTDKEWGDGSESPSIFNPALLNAE